MSYEDYTKNAEAALDFAAWLVEMFSQYGESIFTTEGEAILGNELYVRFGNLLNTSEQTIGFKRVILQSYADMMFNTLPDPADTNNTEYYQAREGIPNSGAEFINKHFGDGFVPEEDRAAEAAVFIALFGGADSLDAAEAFVRHPSFGADAVLECMDENLYINMEDQYMGQQLAESYRAQEAYNYFDNELKGYDDTPLEYGFTFSDVVRNYLIYELGFEEGYGYYPDDPYANNSNGLSSFNPNDNSIVTLKPGAYEEIPVVQENY
jgi:hypothetical protein